MEQPNYNKFVEATEEFKTSVVLCAEHEAKEKTELFAANHRRQAETLSATTRRNAVKKWYAESKEFHAQVGKAAREQLQQFINELAGMTLVIS